jgi:hypothetical protein
LLDLFLVGRPGRVVRWLFVELSAGGGAGGGGSATISIGISTGACGATGSYLSSNTNSSAMSA